MYAILGASGKIGGAAVRDLRRRGLPVRAIIRDPAKAAPLAQAGCDITVADTRDVASLKAALAGANSALVICPMNPKADDAPADHKIKIDTIAEALAQAQPRFIVAISDYGAHQAAGTGVALTFHRLEQSLASLSIPCTVLRSAEHMQNWSRFIQSAAVTGVLPFFYRPRERPLPVVSAFDVGLTAAGLLAGSRAAPAFRRVLHVEGPRRYSIDEIVENIGITVGRPVEGRELAPETWVATLVQAGLSESYANLLAQMYEAHNAGRIDIESPSSEVIKGTTSLAAALASLTSRFPLPS